MSYQSTHPPDGWALGIDVGGTEVKCGAFSRQGELLAQTAVPTRDGEGADGVPAFVLRAREALGLLAARLGGAPSVIGVAAPGLAARDGSCVEFMPGRLQGLEKLEWRGALDFSQPVPVLNDAHAALLGEAWRGAAQGLRDVAMLTLGTGVGGAMICEGRLMRGHLGRAGHFGHLTVDHHGPPTVAGTPGGLDWAIGNASLAERSQGRFSMTRDLAAAAQAGDAFAEKVWLESVHALAAHVAGLICAVDPEAIIIGGGIAELDDFLFQPLRAYLDGMEWRPRGHRVAVRKAALGAWAGACGAAFHALEQAGSARE